MRGLTISTKSKNVAKIIGIIITAIIGALLAIYFFSSTTFNVQGLSINLKATPALTGKTVISLPPVGSLSANTHIAPLEFNASLERIEADTIKEVLADSEGREKLISELTEPKLTFLVPFAWKQLALAAAGAVFLVILIWRTRFWASIVAGVGGAFMIGIFMLIAIYSYNLEAFNEPEYEGVISFAPEMITMGDDFLSQFDEVQTQTELVVENLYNLFGNIDNLPFLGNPGTDEDTVRLLLVSDLHSNPIGVGFINAVVNNFYADAIIDAGDLTDFGSPVEAQLANELKDIEVPYLFAPGNHDTPEIMDLINNMPNGTVLEGQVETIEDINIIGNADPLAYSSEVMNDELIRNRDLRRQIEELRLTAAELEEMVDIIVLHDPKFSTTLEGLANVVVTGHHHRHWIKNGENTVHINPGSTGSSGARGLYSETKVPYSAVLLYYQPGEGPIAADTIAYHPISGRFNVERTLLNR
ncbi:hypothetical protein SYNTR_0331 [Candidatus Syntrophocurvum alkaliphilum]|uniref:Calcineurin-like phosphoesterase domain-containing protein n=1 Tax=Candidatus Syntrophocurvum alkaliphilum TaxID=2293317 RepID=A0A6I6DBU9_9FIRM|nr:metallophosphoesterase family protein [Candidatus Syntrophocurvum alkaliphilum]QGT98924.1 hypothetical protein SYNTR_0331 [Candidatus Syntrophocurvum alkaliphilum]